MGRKGPSSNNSTKARTGTGIEVEPGRTRSASPVWPGTAGSAGRSSVRAHRPPGRRFRRSEVVTARHAVRAAATCSWRRPLRSDVAEEDSACGCGSAGPCGSAAAGERQRDHRAFRPVVVKATLADAAGGTVRSTYRRRSTAQRRRGEANADPPSGVRGALEHVFRSERCVHHFVVREGGLEPPRPWTPEPKSGASANFATRARWYDRPNSTGHSPDREDVGRCFVLAGNPTWGYNDSITTNMRGAHVSRG